MFHPPGNEAANRMDALEADAKRLDWLNSIGFYTTNIAGTRAHDVSAT
ncbi:MAG TPA: hypothetical protein VGG97_06250 [Bryobacteraceae bacterium]